MDMAVHYGLTRYRAAVDTDIESADRSIPFAQCDARLGNQLLAGTHLGCSELKVIGCMPLGDHEAMAISNRKSVIQHYRETVLQLDLSVPEYAEWTLRFPQVV